MTADVVADRLMEIVSYLETDYQNDNISHILDRSQKVLAYMAELTWLINSARLIRDNKAISILSLNPDIKITKLRLLYGVEATLIDNCERVYETLKNTASNLQSQLATARLEKEAYLKDKGTP